MSNIQMEAVNKIEKLTDEQISVVLLFINQMSVRDESDENDENDESDERMKSLKYILNHSHKVDLPNDFDYKSSYRKKYREPLKI